MIYKSYKWLQMYCLDKNYRLGEATRRKMGKSVDLTQLETCNMYLKYYRNNIFQIDSFLHNFSDLNTVISKQRNYLINKSFIAEIC